jgi:hypothetical protein
MAAAVTELQDIDETVNKRRRRRRRETVGWMVGLELDSTGGGDQASRGNVASRWRCRGSRRRCGFAPYKAVPVCKPQSMALQLQDRIEVSGKKKSPCRANEESSALLFIRRSGAIRFGSEFEGGRPLNPLLQIARTGILRSIIRVSHGRCIPAAEKSASGSASGGVIN